VPDPIVITDPEMPGPKRAFLPRQTWIGLGLGLVIGVLLTTIETVFKGYDLEQVALPTYLGLYPLVGLGLGWFVAQSPEPISWRRPTGFFASGPLTPEKAVEWARRMSRSTGVGFLLGIGLAFSAGLLDFLWRGWPYLTLTLVTGLVYGPIIGSMIGYNLGLRRGDPAPSLRNLRFSTRGMLILVAYCGLVLGVGTMFAKYSRAAAQAQSKATSSRFMIQTFEQLCDKQRAELIRDERAQALRQGQIPDGLLPIQTKFLESLNAPGTDPAYRQARFNLIAQGEETSAKLARQNLGDFQAVIEYHRALETKYRNAVKRPWLPIEPDAPPP